MSKSEIKRYFRQAVKASKKSSQYSDKAVGLIKDIYGFDVAGTAIEDLWIDSISLEFDEGAIDDIILKIENDNF